MKSLSVKIPTSTKQNNPVVASNERSSSSQIEESPPGLDFIGSNGAVKGLFLLPYATDQPISVAVHNLGGTLLIDSDPEGDLSALNQGSEPKSKTRKSTNFLKSSERTSERVVLSHDDDKPAVTSNRRSGNDDHTTEIEGAESHVSNSLVPVAVSGEATSEALTIVNSVIQSCSASVVDQETTRDAGSASNSRDGQSILLGLPSPDEYAHHYIPSSPEPREYLSWKFQDMNLLVGSDALIYRSSKDPQSTALTVRVEDASSMKALLAQHEQRIKAGTFVADRELPQLQQVGKPSYAEATRRNLPLIEDKKSNDSESYDFSEKSRMSNASTNDEMCEVSSFAAPDFDSVTLQTCIIPTPNESVGSLLSNGKSKNFVQTTQETSAPHSSPVSTVLDTYLDNIMANVPQLALCLREKGFIQSVKLLDTEAIPSRLLSASTFDTSKPFEAITECSPADEVFSPQIMEMNASALLRFLKSNCSKDNATYLMRREAGQTNIQLYDISSISTQRQRKWIWWLAMISYRFANRLRHVSQVTANKSLRRCFRDRQRSLLQNTLDLLEALADMNGNAHESLVAAVTENFADTFLCAEEEEDDGSQTKSSHNNEPEFSSNSPPPVTSISPQQPYAKSTVDALHKAHDHLTNAIKVLWPVLDSMVENMRRKNSKLQDDHVSVCSVRVGSKDGESDSEDEDDADDASVLSNNEQIDPIATQLYGLHRKLVNVSLRLAEIHLRNYYSSSAMQALRTAARRIANSMYLAQLRAQSCRKDVDEWIQNLHLQYTWLWEHCGHFARSYAADSLWRERGHASGDDVVSVLQDVEAAFVECGVLCRTLPQVFHLFQSSSSFLTEKSEGMLSFQDLSGIIALPSKSPSKSSLKSCSIESSNLDEGIRDAKDIIGKQKTLQRDHRKVLVSACISYSLAIESLNNFASTISVDNTGMVIFDKSLVELLYQRLGDACNEVGKVFLNEVRTLLTAIAANPLDNSVLALDPFLSSAEFWFIEGLHAFEKSQDLRNLALLRCNLCQCFKLRANNIFAGFHHCHLSTNSKKSSGMTKPSHAELCLQESANHLQAAHEILGERDADPMTWDMVSGELAATFLVLGVRRRQTLIGSGNIPLIAQELRLDQGKERSIVEPMERALHIYEQMGNYHQAAAAHYQLASFYSKIWTCQRDEAKTREKLGSAFKHYSTALGYFTKAVRGNEITLCILCTDLASLYSAVSGEECLGKAVLRCLDTSVAFSPECIQEASANLQTRDDWIDKMQTLSTSVEELLFKLLRSLVKLEDENKANAMPGQKYKDLYRVGLQAKMTAATKAPIISIGDSHLNKKANQLLQLRFVLTEIAAHVPTTW